MKDIETYYAKDLGKISRPFSDQLKARTLADPIRELYRSKIAKIEALLYPVIGVDISYWQGNIDFGRLASKVYFIFIRAGRGNADYDTNYKVYLKGAHDRGRAVGIYWYMKPNTGTNWKQHVASFVSAYKDSGSQLPPVFDVEETSLSKTETTGWLQKAINSFYEQTNVYPMIYTSAGFWNANVYRNDWAKNLDLWDAHWTTADEPIIPNDWGAINNPETWDFWQHSSKGDGIAHGVSSTFIDLNRHHYSLATFNLRYKTNLSPLGSDIPIPPTPIEDKIKPLYFAETTAQVLNARAGDGANYSDIGNLPNGTLLPVVEESGDWLKTEFWFHKGYTKKL